MLDDPRGTIHEAAAESSYPQPRSRASWVRLGTELLADVREMEREVEEHREIANKLTAVVDRLRPQLDEARERAYRAELAIVDFLDHDEDIERLQEFTNGFAPSYFEALREEAARRRIEAQVREVSSAR